MSITFEGVSYEEALKRSEETEVWIVDQVIGSHTTLLYGEAKVGKSFIVSALIASLTTGTDFLGKPVPQDRDFNIAVCWTDDAGEVEYSSRIRSVMPDDQTPKVKFYQLPIMQTPSYWEALFEAVMRNGHNFVVIDNMAQTLNGSVNDDAEVRRFFDGIRQFTRAGIPVVVVAHSSDKAGQNGYKPETPMGSAYITQAVRWRIFARRSKRGNVTLKFMGNHAEPYEMTLYHGAGARFEVLDTKTAEALKASAEGNARARDKAKLDANAQLREWLNENCSGASVKAAAEAYAEKHGVSPESARTKIRRSGLKNNGGTWEFGG